jgi:hypothetical protein
MKSNTNRKVLDGLPVRDWQTESTYDALLIVPTGQKHDSGYAVIAIVGARYRGPDEPGGPVEIAAYCDDIEVRFSNEVPESKRYATDDFRVDMSYPSGIANWWGARFTVGESLSSTVVTVLPRIKP